MVTKAFYKIPVSEKQLTTNAEKMDKYIGLSDLAQFIGTFSEMQSQPAEVFRNKCALRLLHL
jgi:hypothetical protein